MQDLIGTLAGQAGIDPATTEKATAMIVAFVADHASPELADLLRNHLPDFDALAAAGAAHTAAAEAESRSEGLGGLFSGGLAGALGGLLGGDGPLGEAMALVGRLGRDGVDLDQIRTLASGLVEHLRASGGAEVVDRFLAEIPGASHLFG